MAKGGGIESKGKTKGKNLGDTGTTVPTEKLSTKAGGVTSASMKSVGRNMARANYQRGR